MNSKAYTYHYRFSFAIMYHRTMNKNRLYSFLSFFRESVVHFSVNCSEHPRNIKGLYHILAVPVKATALRYH